MASVDTRERLIEAASALFRAKGYNAVGVQEVCRAADANKGSFYHFFDSKEALMRVVIEQRRGLPCPVDRELPEGVPARDVLVMMYDAAVTEVEAQHRRTGHITGCPIGSVAAEASTVSESIRVAADQALRFMTTTMATMLRVAADEGDLDPRSTPDEVAQRLVAYVQGALLLAKTQNDPTVLQTLRPGYLQLLGFDTPHRQGHAKS